MKQKELKRCIFTLVLFSLILFCFSSCRMRAEQNSLTSQFDVIDALVMQNQMQSALKELKKAEKRAYDSWTYIGIYKRYVTIGDSVRAEKLLKKALKKNSGNEELLAVYSVFLMREGRLGECLKVAEKLRGTKYASIYSECILRDSAAKAASAIEAGGSSAAYTYYSKKEFYQIYLDAYKTSRNPLWLRNCAVFNLTNGDYALAAEGTTLFVQYKGNNVVYVENNFTPGSMPFPILATSGEKQTTDVKAVEAEETQPAVKSYKRIENGKFVIVKDGKQYNSAGQQL